MRQNNANSLISSTHDKTETFTMIRVWTNPIVIFSIIGAGTKKLPSLKASYHFVPGFSDTHTHTPMHVRKGKSLAVMPAQ